MKFLVLIACLSFVMNSQAQESVKRPDVPLEKGSGRVVYTAVKQTGGTQSELYAKSKSWFQDYFKNPSEVIKDKDDERFMVLGKHGINIYRDMKWGKETTQQKVGMVKYRIKIIAKDGRYKYKIDDIFLVKGIKEYVELWLDDALPAEEMNQNYHYLTQVNDHMKNLIKDMHEVMSAPPPDAPEEW